MQQLTSLRLFPLLVKGQCRLLPNVSMQTQQYLVSSGMAPHLSAHGHDLSTSQNSTLVLTAHSVQWRIARGSKKQTI